MLTLTGLRADGVTNVRPAIQAAINAAYEGVGSGIVMLPPGMYGIDAPLVLKSGVTLRGTRGSHLEKDNTVNLSSIRPLAGFDTSGSCPAAIAMLGASEGGYSSRSTEQRILDLTIDGSAVTGSGVHGIGAYGNVHGVRISNVNARKMGGSGLWTKNTSGIGGSGAPFSWRVTHSVFDTCGLAVSGTPGVLVDSMTDSLFFDVMAFACNGHGFTNVGTVMSTFQNCRAEWCNQNGFYWTRAVQMRNCSTDSNKQNGCEVNGINVNFHDPMIIDGCRFHRDGRDGANYAGLYVHDCTAPVLVSDVVVTVGVDDGGGGSSRPDRGVSFVGNSHALIAGACHVWGVTTGYHTSGSNPGLVKPSPIIECTGTFSGQTFV